MLTLRTITLAILGSCLMTVGCIAEPVDEEGDVGEAEQSIIIINGTNPDFFWSGDTQSALRLLAHARIVDSSGQIPSTILFNSQEGRQLMTHVVQCAMPEGTTLKNVQAGFTAKGLLGLATDWKNVPLDWESGQRWMTACLLQTLNGVGAHVNINATGWALPVDPSQDTSEYVFGDMIAFGNIYGGAPKAYACHVKQFEAACGNATSYYEQLRICGTSPACGITLLGTCTEGVCDTDDKGNSKCQSPSGETYSEAIKTTLEKTGFHTLYSDCALVQ